MVQDLRGLVSHSNNSATCIKHHPVIVSAIHLKCGTPDLNNIAIEINEDLSTRLMFVDGYPVFLS